MVEFWPSCNASFLMIRNMDSECIQHCLQQQCMGPGRWKVHREVNNVHNYDMHQPHSVFTEIPYTVNVP